MQRCGAPSLKHWIVWLNWIGNGCATLSLSVIHRKKRWRKKARMQLINIFEYEMLAKERMNPVFWDFYAGGSDDEITLRANQADFARIRLRPRMLVDANQCDTSTSVLGLPVPMPLLVAPTSMHCLAHPEGECATVQGVGAAGTLMIASTDATRPLEEIAQA